MHNMSTPTVSLSEVVLVKNEALRISSDIAILSPVHRISC